MSAGDLSGVRALVTGAAGGLGEAIATAYCRRGAHVVAHARESVRLAELSRRAREAGWALTVVAGDLSDPRAAAEVGTRAAKAAGGVDIVVHCAALLGSRAPLAEQDIELWRRVFAVNVTGVLALTQALLPAMPDGAAIVNVTSGAAGRAGWGAYALSKLALNGLSDMLREELAPRRIRCVTVDPGAMRTPMRAAAYPAEDPAMLDPPEARVAPFVALAAGADLGPHIRAAAA